MACSLPGQAELIGPEARSGCSVWDSCGTFGLGQKAYRVMDEPPRDRAAHHRALAAEARARAEAISDYAARATMMKVAAIWDDMAAKAEKKSP